MATPLNVGDIVDVRRFGRAEVIEQAVTDPAHKFVGRVRIKYQRDGATRYCRPETLRKIDPPPGRIVVCQTTDEYKAAAIAYTNYTDALLEVGCHEGETTWLMHNRSYYVVGTDKSVTAIGLAQKRFPTLRLHAVDGFDIDELKRLAPAGGSFQRILVDIGGIAPLPSVLSLVGAYYRAFKGAVIIVKSVFMQKFIQDTKLFPSSACNNWLAVQDAATDVREASAAQAAEEPSGEPAATL